MNRARPSRKPGSTKKRPHNAKTGIKFDNLPELILRLGAEKKLVNLNGAETEMVWAERSLRLTVERALAGNRRDLLLLLKMMSRYPETTGAGRATVQYFIRGALAHV